MVKKAIVCVLMKRYVTLMMKIAIFSLAFIVSITATAKARLGENPDQLAQRYGQPLSEFDHKRQGDKIQLTDLIFQKGGYQINVTLSDGISVAESYKKINGAVLTVSEVQTLLNDNSEGSGWEAPHEVEGLKKWARDDDAEATLTGSRILLITSKQLMDEKTQAKQLEQQPSLDGF